MPTKISWCDETINPTKVKGGGWYCSKISPGCANCYAERINKRFGNKLSYDNRQVEYVLDDKALSRVFSWKKPKRIFIKSMSDLFHPDLAQKSPEYIADIFGIITKCPQHIFLVLTKRPQIMREWVENWRWRKLPYYKGIKGIRELPPNLYLGVSIENQQAADERIPILLQIPAAVHWVSVEPLLGPVDLSKFLVPQYYTETKPTAPNWIGAPPTTDFVRIRQRLSWCVVGAETGPGARPMHPDWVRKVRDDCVATGVPFWFKSWGEWAGPEIYRDMDSIQAINISYVDKEGKTYEKYHEIIGRKGIAYIARVGKKYSGNRLDGRIWEQLP